MIMTKVKNTKIIKKQFPKGPIQGGKVKKIKPTNPKKLKNVVGKTVIKNVVPNVDTDVVTSKKPQKKIVPEEKILNANKNKKEQKVADAIGQQKDQKKPKKFKGKKAKPAKKPANAKKDPKAPKETELEKIERLKAKKLAKKLKSKQKRLVKIAEAKASVTAADSDVDSSDSEENDEEDKQVVTKADKPEDAATKVIAKKEKKAKKKQLLKEQRLEEKRNRDPAAEEATIFVGNLPVNTKRVQLIRLFKEYGPISSIRLRSAGGTVLHKHKQRREAGSLNAYCVLTSKEKAEKALALNGAEFKNVHVRVTLASKSPQAHELDESKRTVFVGNLKYTATEESLREIFTSCGEIAYVRCIRDGDKGCKGVAYVCFKTADAVGLALELNETILDERPIHVERYSVKKLGAKEKRDAQADKELKSKPGAKQRINNKKPQNKTPINKSSNDGKDDKKPKKTEFRGVKVNALKKKQKKKSNNQMVQLAKKIAPKTKKE